MPGYQLDLKSNFRVPSSFSIAKTNANKSLLADGRCFSDAETKANNGRVPQRGYASTPRNRRLAWITRSSKSGSGTSLLRCGNQGEHRTALAVQRTTDAGLLTN